MPTVPHRCPVERRRRSCSWAWLLAAAALLSGCQRSRCAAAAALDPEPTSHPTSPSQRRALLQAYASADKVAVAEVSEGTLPAHLIDAPDAAKSCGELRVMMRSHVARCGDELRPQTCVDLQGALYALCASECVVNLQRLYNRAHYLPDCDVDDEVVMDMDTSEPCGTNSDCCADQACLPFGLGGPQSAPVCGFAQCVLNATAATFNQTCVTANTLARGSPLARQVMMTYEFMCQKHDGSGDLCLPKAQAQIALGRDINCGQAMGLGCCMASYSLVARKCQYSGIAPAVYQQLDVRFLGMMDNMTTQCSLPTKPCVNFKVDELGSGVCRAAAHEDASAALPLPAVSAMAAAAAAMSLLLALY